MKNTESNNYDEITLFPDVEGGGAFGKYSGTHTIEAYLILSKDIEIELEMYIGEDEINN